MYDTDLMNCTQPNTVTIPFRIDVAGGTPSVVEGTRWLSVDDTGAGIITVTLSPGAARNLIVYCMPVDTATGVKTTAHVRSLDADSFIIETIDEAGSNVDDTDVMGFICAFRNEDEK